MSDAIKASTRSVIAAMITKMIEVVHEEYDLSEKEVDELFDWIKSEYFRITGHTQPTPAAAVNPTQAAPATAATGGTASTGAAQTASGTSTQTASNTASNASPDAKTGTGDPEN